MKLKSEIERIKGVYEKRKEQIPSFVYSFFNDTNLYFVQGRDKEILKVLKSYNATSLDNKKVLDIGCDTGKELINLIRYGANPTNLYGIDVLEDRIETAQRLSPNIHFLCLDASEIPYEDSSFDIVIQFTVFTSILDDQMKKNIAS